MKMKRSEKKVKQTRKWTDRQLCRRARDEERDDKGEQERVREIAKEMK